MIPTTWTPLRPHPLQDRAWKSHAQFLALDCGRGSGKTELARRKVVQALLAPKPWRRPAYFYALPTYDQARRVAWNPIKALVPPEWISKINETTMLIETKLGSALYVVGMDKPQRIEGDQWDGCILDESSDQKPGSFARSVVPSLAHRSGWCWRIGVPKRTGCGAGEFRQFCTGTNSDLGPIAQERYTWPSADILSPEQLSWAMENLDPKDFREQYEASWETVGGLVFYAFSETQNVSDEPVYDPDKQLIVGSDFNVDPMAWVVCQQLKSDLCLEVIGEIWLRNTNTREALDSLSKRFPEHRGGWMFFGDATGAARKTSAATSDYLQIRNDRRFEGARVYYPRQNPKVADRFAACNALFLNAAGERRLVVHSRCRNLIRDLTTRAYVEGTSEPDDYGDVGHVTDALGYVVHKMFPLRQVSEAAPGVHAIAF